jgi:5-(carboxyamino)imidazole ribonucleotide synthase
MKIGVLGSGQLGRMLALAGLPLGHTFSFYDSTPSTSTMGLGPVTAGAFDDVEALTAFARDCDVVTYEFENGPCKAAEAIQKIVPVYPPPRALEVSQDRVIEKEFFRSLDIPTPDFRAVASEPELRTACSELGTPCIVKTRRLGYDGKGQARISTPSEVAPVWQALGGTPLIVEAFVPFSRELSVIAVRAINGQIKIYPLAFNIHRSGILYRSEIPAPGVSQALAQGAYEIITKVLNELQYVGVLAIELFEIDGRLVANEMAPRVHNSGHATIDGSTTSQFENHIRAITGLALGSVVSRASAIMYNLVGTLPDEGEITDIPSSRLHLYHKAPRPGRKLGHVTLVNPTSQDEERVKGLIGGGL